MIGFRIGHGRATTSIANEEAGFQIGAVSFVQIEIFKQLHPHSSSWLPVHVASCSGKEDHREVEVAEDGAHLALERGEASLIAFDGFGVISKADAALVRQDGYRVAREDQ